MLILRATIGIVAFSNTFLIMKMSSLAGLSISVVFSLTSVAGFITALLFYFIYKERLLLQHIIGMNMLMLCVITVGFSKEVGSSLVTHAQQFDTPSWIPIGLVLI